MSSLDETVRAATTPCARAVAVVDAVLATARQLLGCELVALNRFDPEHLLTTRTNGSLPGLTPGARSRRTDTPCHLVLASGAPVRTSNAPHDCADAAAVTQLGLQTYVGVPVLDEQDEPVATLCGFDRRPVPVSDRVVGTLVELARVLSPYAEELRRLDVALVRGPDGWVIEGVEREDTGTALATLVQDDPSAAPARQRDWLVGSVQALESVLHERVLLEQALGVLSEQQHVGPRQAYDELRQRAGQDDLHQVAGAVVAAAARRPA